MTRSIDSIRTGDASYELVVAIDGYPHLLSNAPQAAVQAAWADTDWAAATVIGGVVVELENKQEIDPWNPLKGGGQVLLKVQPDDDDLFGIDLHRTDAGAESVLTQTADRDALTIYVGSTDTFPYSGEAHIGLECFAYSMLASGSFVVTDRGKYVAHGRQGSSPTRFAEHHRVATADNGVRLAPLVTQYPRSWTGRRVSIWWHTWDQTTGALNSKDDALCIFAGQITEPLDDSETGHTHVLCESILDQVKDAGIGRDQWQGTLSYGHQVLVGMVFKFRDYDGVTYHDANDLVVVASGASTPNEIDAGRYGVEEIAAFLNAWLAEESGHGRIVGSYTMSTPEDVNGQPRTVMHFYIAGTNAVNWLLTWPDTTWSRCIGLPGSQYWGTWDTPNAGHATVSPAAPLPGVVFQLDSNLLLEADLDDQTGTQFGQYATLPSGAKAAVPPSLISLPWGLFIVDGETPLVLVGYLDGTRLFCRVLTRGLTRDLQTTVDLGNAAVVPPGDGPPKIRQIFVHEGRTRDMLKWFFYSTGTAGYNHPTFDILPYGHGLGLPHGILGTNFESSCDLLPHADDLLTVVIDKTKKFEEQFRADLVMRNAHLVWREGGLRFISWTTPSAALATVTLDDSTKARPAENEETAQQRPASVLDGTMVRNLIKINYNRDITQSGDGGAPVFTSPPIELEDATSVDDHGVKLLTLDAINVYGDTDAIGQGVRALAADLLAWMPWWSRPLWRVNLPIDIRLFEGFGVGDVVAVTDDFVRDPTTGRRRIVARPGLVVHHTSNIGGVIAGDPTKKPRPMAGEVDVVFLTTDRTFLYAPAAELDETVNGGGFTAGYDGNVTLQFKANEHAFGTETVDIGRFAAADRVKLVEIDPANPAAPDMWERTIATTDPANNRATINAALAVPAFSAAKRYRLIFDDYPDAQQSQRSKAFQAGANLTIAQLAPANLYGSQSADPTLGVPPTIDHTRVPELPANLSYGPNVGAGRDTGYDKELALLVENLMDHKTARSSPVLDTARGNLVAVGLRLTDVQEHFIGDMIPSAGIERYLCIGPHWAANGGNPGLVQVRVTVSGHPPAGSSLLNATIKQPAISVDWFVSGTDTSWRNDIEQRIPLSYFAGFQWVYVIVECSNTAMFRGFHLFRETERVES